jgi:hypothetical protein
VNALSRRHAAALVALGAAVGGSYAGAGSHSRPRPEPPHPLGMHSAASVAPASAEPSWHGGAYTAADGERVTVYVSDSYPAGDAGQRWADFFSRLLHGDELASLRVYVAPPRELGGLCGNSDVAGCYGGNELVIPDEPVDGIAAESIAMHEYGHHIAAHRVNAPWSALAWGTKRWASYEQVCSRTQAGTAFPGDEGARYTLNPGEAFAETYRALSESSWGATSFEWPIVTRGFYPDAAALENVRGDVVEPWTGPTTRSVAGRFTRDGAHVWTLPLATPLDGDLTATLRLAAGSADDIAVLAPDGRTPLANGLWSSAGRKLLSFRICGQRTLTLRVTRRGAPHAFAVEVTQP